MVLLALVALELYWFITKMYAIIKNSVVIWYFIGKLENAKKQWKNCDFVEMTEKNSPATIGDKWNGEKFIKGDVNV